MSWQLLVMQESWLDAARHTRILGIVCESQSLFALCSTLNYHDATWRFWRSLPQLNNSSGDVRPTCRILGPTGQRIHTATTRSISAFCRELTHLCKGRRTNQLHHLFSEIRHNRVVIHDTDQRDGYNTKENAPGQDRGGIS